LAQKINPSLEKIISRKTICRRLIQKKLFSYVAQRKPLLKPSDRIRRMNFCRQMLRMTQAELNSIVFSDETNFEVHNGKNRVLVRRFSHEKYDDRFVTPRVQGGGIGYKGIGSMKIYNGRLNQYVYRNILDESLIPTIHKFFGNSSSFYFQHDNAPCHSAHSIRTYFELSNIRVLEWPALFLLEDFKKKKAIQLKITKKKKLKKKQIQREISKNNVIGKFKLRDNQMYKADIEQAVKLIGKKYEQIKKHITKNSHFK